MELPVGPGYGESLDRTAAIERLQEYDPEIAPVAEALQPLDVLNATMSREDFLSRAALPEGQTR